MTQSGPADMTPEGPAHLVAWSWRCRMVGSPTVAAGTPPYPLLGSGRERFSGVARSCSARESTHVHRAGFSRTALSYSWGGNSRGHLGPMLSLAPVRSDSGGRLASADQVPVVAWSQRNQAPVVAAPDQAPCGQADRPAWNCLPETALQGNRATTQSSEAANGSTSPSCRKSSCLVG